jgi:hypothetical protein
VGYERGAKKDHREIKELRNYCCPKIERGDKTAENYKWNGNSKHHQTVYKECGKAILVSKPVDKEGEKEECDQGLGSDYDAW